MTTTPPLFSSAHASGCSIRKVTRLRDEMEKGRDHLALKSIAAGGQYAQNCTTSTAASCNEQTLRPPPCHG
ncbi:hypothetical protein OsJ_35948 [Oryza sativa Japonica Group]|uniref:Uncharacterized protein n=1 Tax=Oryza sativa subsp. japonica TaxID=39947 RepID=B9GCY3_ORYSJ|nr:hypothetical protein OsJ_35948 [Oryza sativa Japonica Group]